MAMGFRFRRSARLGPLRFNFAKGGLSSISVGGRARRLLADGALKARTTGLLALIETPEALEGYLLRAQGQDDAKRPAQQPAVKLPARLAAGRGWLS